MKEILTVIFQSNAMTYGMTQIEMKMLWLLSRGTKGGRTEEISTETHGLTGSRIYSLTGSDGIDGDLKVSRKEKTKN